jgi:hypothetical protein
MERRRDAHSGSPIQRWLIGAATVLGALCMFGGVAVAATTASDLPPNWHVHDGQASLGSQHKGIGFFPVILGLTTGQYLQDPARCPNATDKAFLPSVGTSESPLLRAGECQTSTEVIHLRTVPVGTAGPEGWSSITTASEPGWVTYYQVSSR